MTRSGLFLVTLFTVLLTGLAVVQAGWCRPQAGRSLLPRAGKGSSSDPFSSDAAWRFRHCQANHWRACLLQH